ncbi:MAG: hypothetical protein GY928_25600 [Colwellia sp.]|nr:hypothetical protein [Colwellia sp.]
MQKITSYIKENITKTLIFVICLYGISLFLFGLFNGVYWNEWTSLYKLLGLCKEDDSYIVSFYASAEQDFWFFLIIGIFASLITTRQAKEDGLTAKVNIFFPGVVPASAHMRYLESEINIKSCIATSFTRRITISSIENGLIETIISAKTNIKNIHHNHDLDENYGSFSISPDESVVEKKPVWGRISNFTLETNNNPDIEIASPQDLNESIFERSYNIKLSRGAKGKLTCNYSIWEDMSEELEATATMYTFVSNLELFNNTDTALTFLIRRNKEVVKEVTLEPKQSLPQTLSFKDIRPDNDIIGIKITHHQDQGELTLD